jgi:hypothetical protein
MPVIRLPIFVSEKMVKSIIQENPLFCFAKIRSQYLELLTDSRCVIVEQQPQPIRSISLPTSNH